LQPFLSGEGTAPAAPPPSTAGPPATPPTPTPAAPGVTIKAVANGASFGGRIAPGSLISVFGEKLASSIVPATQVPLPTTLGGVTITVNGVKMPLSFVSPGQVNAQLPFETPVGKVTFVLTSGTQQAMGSIEVSATAP